MKTWILAIALLAVFGMSGIADACKTGKSAKHAGVHGKVLSVGQGTFTLTSHAHGKGKNGAANAAAGTGAGQMMTIRYTISTTVNGAAGKIDSSLVGKEVNVIGPQSGNVVNAMSVTVMEGHHGKR